MEIIKDPWPWYIAGPLIGLVVPFLLLIGNKGFGISSTYRQICAAVCPSNIPFLNYDWKKENWNFFFLIGLLTSGFLVNFLLKNDSAIAINPSMVEIFRDWEISDPNYILPLEFTSFEFLFSLKGFFTLVVGGFLVGFGARYAGGCTSGHAIMGLSNLQLPSLVSVIGFFMGGLVVAHFLLPVIL